MTGERCEDRSLLLSDENKEKRCPSEPEESLKAKQSSTCHDREHYERSKNEEEPLMELYKVIITPVADLLKGSEIIVASP